MNTPDISLNSCQQNALDSMLAFLDTPSQRVFILNGYAGTGKTTLMRFLISRLREQKRPYHLLSTTGRAAKILANYTGEDARTIHSMIYSFKDLNKDLSDISLSATNVDSTGQLFLVFEPATLQSSHNPNIYIIDEASMISDTEVRHVMQAQFGTGRLLKELFDYDPNPNSKFIFVGDPCQLPPVSGAFSPALSKSYINTAFSADANEACLTQIMRQADNAALINASSKLRTLWSNAPETAEEYAGNKVWGMLPFRQCPDIHLHADMDTMLTHYIDNIRAHGYNHSVLICRSNADCVKISQSVRQSLGFNRSLCEGDLLMVIQNQMTTGLMNGDMVEIVSMCPESERTYHDVKCEGIVTHLVFREVKVRELFTHTEHTTLLLESTILQQQNNLDSRQQSGLFLDFVMRMKRLGITQKKDGGGPFRSAMQSDPYLNALRCAYGYAVTCHKAQGGEWNEVYIHLGARNFTLNPTKATYQWIYTALTRGKNAVHMIDDFYIR